MLKSLLRNKLFWLVFALPNLLCIAYFGFIAAPVYVSEARFVVDQSGSRQSVSLQSILSQSDYSLGGASLVKSYIGSPDAVQALDAKIDLRAAYGAPKGDFISRLGGLAHLDTSAVGLREFMSGRIEDRIDEDSSVSTLRVYAYSAKDAHEINRALIDQSLSVIDSLNQQRVDEIASVAHQNVETISGQLQTLKSSLLSARTDHAVFDPQSEADLTGAVIQSLQEEIARKQASLATLRDQTPNSPLLKQRSIEISSLKDQAEALQSRISGAANSISTSDALISSLESEIKITTQLLLSARQAEQSARVSAASSNYFIEVLSEPSRPDRPERPLRLYIIMSTLLGSLIVWSFLR